MKLRISDRMSKPDFQGDFTSAILKAAASPDVISFAGGLPNPDSFPVKEMEAAVTKVLERDGVRALQYSNTEGYMPLRQFISDRYKKQGVDFAPENIIITNGSQQALDMVAATLINPGDTVAVEKPSYLAALQTFHLYDPKIVSVSLNDDGIDCDELERYSRKTTRSSSTSSPTSRTRPASPIPRPSASARPRSSRPPAPPS